jgi:mannosyl-oligosaccharide alpha-1,2-mannosidase
MWKITGLQKYRDLAWDFLLGIEKACRLQDGYALPIELRNTTRQWEDLMESFFLSETLKYLYLIFSDSKFVSPTEWVFNTEAHPFKIMGPEIPDALKEMLQFNGIGNAEPLTE